MRIGLGVVVVTLWLLLVARYAHPADIYVSDWTVTVSENGVERNLSSIWPGEDRNFKFIIDQNLAPGWSCEVRPQVWKDSVGYRWMTCTFQGRARAQIKTECRSDRAGSKMQELWLGDNVGIRLSCRSGVSP